MKREEKKSFANEYIIDLILQKCNEKELIEQCEPNIIFHSQMHTGHILRVIKAIKELKVRL